jgi:hypothetical protein
VPRVRDFVGHLGGICVVHCLVVEMSVPRIEEPQHFG